jgi:transcriptional regulator with XRE-family HTH domain
VSERGIAVAEIVTQLVLSARRKEGLSVEKLAERSGLDPAYLGLVERGARQPTLVVAATLADALGLSLSALFAAAEQQAGIGDATAVELLPVPRTREANRRLLGAGRRLAGGTELTPAMLAVAIDFAYRRLDLIDAQMRGAGSRPLGKLVDTADLTATLAHLLSAGIARASNSRYVQNGREQAPDLLLPLRQGLPEVEVKTALETTLPPRGARGAGAYLIFRYVLTERDGSYRRGKEGRGDTITVWEARFGELREEHFRSGPRGSARLTRSALEGMELVYYDPALLPYAQATGAYAPG